MKPRISSLKRNTNETKINIIKFNIDGDGKYKIELNIGFLKHMLELFSKHGQFDLELIASGDVEVDYHHTVEDIGICMGQCFKKALGNMEGMNRYGYSLIPMDESLAETSVDISNRPVLVFKADFPNDKVGDFDTELIHEFLEKFVLNAGITLHINLRYCNNTHHGIEAIFKSLAKTLKTAVTYNPNIKGQNTTKGIL